MRISRALPRLASALRSVSYEQWFLLVFSFLVALFIAVLLTESTSVGRGGR